MRAFGNSVLICYIIDMRIQRSGVQAEPHLAVFEIDEETRFYEQVVARNAMMLSPYDLERLEMDHETATNWAHRSFVLSARKNGEFQTNTMKFDKDDLRYFGGLLIYFSDTTSDELYRLVQGNPQQKDIYSSRLYEARLARKMSSVVADRVKVTPLWTPNRRRVIGFSK